MSPAGTVRVDTLRWPRRRAVRPEPDANDAVSVGDEEVSAVERETMRAIEARDGYRLQLGLAIVICVDQPNNLTGFRPAGVHRSIWRDRHESHTANLRVLRDREPRRECESAAQRVLSLAA